MDITVILLLMTFLVSVGALMVFVWSMSKGLFGTGPEASRLIFDQGEQGKIEDPALTEIQRRAFQQDMNRVRAMEGELARSISSLSGVRSARVHLVLPRRLSSLR